MDVRGFFRTFGRTFEIFCIFWEGRTPQITQTNIHCPMIRIRLSFNVRNIFVLIFLFVSVDTFNAHDLNVIEN